MFMLYCMSGIVFGAAVLWPVIDRNHVLAAGAALLTASILSYFVAVETAMLGPNFTAPTTLNFIAASLVGAAIILLAVTWPARIRWRPSSAAGAIAAAILGGYLFALTFNLNGPLSYVGFPAWHSLQAWTIHYAIRGSR